MTPKARAHPPRGVHRAAFPLLVLAVLAASPAAALVRPLEARGDFQAQLDVYDRERGDGAVDVVVLISIPNTQLAFRQTWGEGLSGRLACDLALETDAGAVHARRDTLEVRVLRREDARSPALYQVFSLELAGVDAPYGALSCTLADLEWHRSREGEGGRPPTAAAAGEWVRAEALDQVRGLYLHPPLFLSGAPRALLPRDADGTPAPRRRVLSEHLHPNRRYGLEQDRLQITFDVERTGFRPSDPGDLPRTLMMQVLARDLDFALRDTVRVLEDPVAFAAAGGHAAVTWELDVNALPPGAYQLSCAPLDGFGNSWIAEFDVLWSAAALARPSPELWLMGNLVFGGRERDEFRAAGPAEQEALLAQFWADHDPDTSTRFNEAELEFRRRMRHVRRHLGGFGESRALDDRGWIYLLLGAPDEVEKQVIPLNADSFDSAVERVYDAWAPLQFGVQDRPLVDADGTSIQAERERRDRVTGMDRFKAWELWSYDNKGESLFPNPYVDASLGMRFLFVARLSESVYTLESSSAHDRGSSIR